MNYITFGTPFDKTSLKKQNINVLGSDKIINITRLKRNQHLYVRVTWQRAQHSLVQVNQALYPWSFRLTLVQNFSKLSLTKNT